MGISITDHEHLDLIRKNVSDSIRSFSHEHDRQGSFVIDVAPQDSEGAERYFTRSEVATVDIDENSQSTFTLDICKNNSDIIQDCVVDAVVCTEVLEHTLNPFAAVAEMYRWLKPGGAILITTPFNFRIHGPLPDCWRFTEHGLSHLFRNFSSVDIQAVDTYQRDLMPVCYRLAAIK